jgi:hypothetical protein
LTFSEDVQKGLIAGAFGLVGTLVPAVISWNHDRSAVSARARTLEDATKRLAFWEQWLKLSAQVAGPGETTTSEQLQRELVRLGEIIQKDSVLTHAQQNMRTKSSEFINKLDDLPMWRRALLLYRPARSAAWFPRIFFFIGLLSSLIIPAGFAAPKDPLSGKDFLISELFFLVWMAIFRSLSRWLEQPRHAAIDPEIHVRTPPPPPPMSA